MNIFSFILLRNIVPIVFLVLIGFLLGKKFKIDIQTLSKLFFYVYMPFFIFIQICTIQFPSNILKVLLFVILLGAANTIVAQGVARIRKYEVGFKNAFINSITFYNSGNIGIPLITLIYSSGQFLVSGQTPYLAVALSTQVIVLIVQNISTNTIGFFNAGRGNMDWKTSVKGILKMPTIYAIPAAFIIKATHFDIQSFPLWPALEYIKEGLISISLITLGAQLANTKLKFGSIDVYISSFVRLIGGAVLAVLLIHLLGFNGVPAQVLMISSALPTAVNTALIAVERNNYPEFASQAVISTTLCSAVTITFVIYVSRLLFPVI